MGYKANICARKFTANVRKSQLFYSLRYKQGRKGVLIVFQETPGLLSPGRGKYIERNKEICAEKTFTQLGQREQKYN